MADTNHAPKAGRGQGKPLKEAGRVHRVRHQLLVTVTVVTMLSSSANAATAKRTLKFVALMKGECSALVVKGANTKCDGVVTNQSWSDARTSFTFMAPNGEAAVTFSGMGNNQVKLDANTAAQPVDVIFLTYGGKHEVVPAVGSCRFGNPYNGKAQVECTADTSGGPFRAVFLSDGAPPSPVKQP